MSCSMQLIAQNLDRSCPTPFCPPLQSCINVEKKLKKIKECVNDCFENLDERCKQVCDKIESAEDPCNNCSPISTPTTITVPGCYCLVADIVGTVTIAADNVTLDLNDHIISGTDTITVENQRNIIIRNGILKALDDSAVVSNCSNVTIQNITCSGDLNFDDVIGFQVNQCSFVEDFANLQFDRCRNGKITCCSLTDNEYGRAIRIANCSNIVCRQVAANNNKIITNVFEIFFSSNCIFKECSVNNNSASASGDDDRINGFFTNGCNDILFKACQANNNSFGNNDLFSGIFRIRQCFRVIVDSCQALNNSFINGFLIDGVEQSCIINCLAKSNDRDGFRLNFADDCFVNNNTAINNN